MNFLLKNPVYPVNPCKKEHQAIVILGNLSISKFLRNDLTERILIVTVLHN